MWLQLTQSNYKPLIYILYIYVVYIYIIYIFPNIPIFNNFFHIKVTVLKMKLRVLEQWYPQSTLHSNSLGSGFWTFGKRNSKKTLKVHVCVVVGLQGEVGSSGLVFGSRWLSEWGFALIRKKVVKWKNSFSPGWCCSGKAADLSSVTGICFQGSCPHSESLLRTGLDENFK